MSGGTRADPVQAGRWKNLTGGKGKLQEALTRDYISAGQRGN